MKKQVLNFVAFAVMGVALISCGEEKPTPEVKKEVKKEEVCQYRHNPNDTKVHWTSFKHTAKNAVKGTFSKFEVNGKLAESPEELLKTFGAKVFINSVYSGDSIRDVKIVEYFFGNMNDTDFIEGMIKSAENGKGVMSMKMNEVKQDVPFTYSISDDLVLDLKMEIDVLDFHGEDALAGINKVCADKHTGEDGIKKIWPNVEINIISHLEKECK